MEAEGVTEVFERNLDVGWGPATCHLCQKMKTVLWGETPSPTQLNLLVVSSYDTHKTASPSITHLYRTLLPTKIEEKRTLAFHNAGRGAKGVFV